MKYRGYICAASIAVAAISLTCTALYRRYGAADSLGRCSHGWGRGGKFSSTKNGTVGSSTTPAATDPVLPSRTRSEALDLLRVLKATANTAFQESRLMDALRLYQDCVEVTRVLGAADREAVQLEQTICSNIVMVLIRMKEYHDARALASRLLDDPLEPLPQLLQVKVVYRRGLASKALGDVDAALADMRAAVQLSENKANPAAQVEIESLLKAKSR